MQTTSAPKSLRFALPGEGCAGLLKNWYCYVWSMRKFCSGVLSGFQVGYQEGFRWLHASGTTIGSYTKCNGTKMVRKNACQYRIFNSPGLRHSSKHFFVMRSIITGERRSCGALLGSKHFFVVRSIITGERRSCGALLGGHCTSTSEGDPPRGRKASAGASLSRPVFSLVKTLPRILPAYWELP